MVVLLGYFIGINLTGDVEHRTLAALIDPFGMTAIDSVTDYWPSPRRTPGSSVSRAASCGTACSGRAIAVGLFAFTYRRFAFSVAGRIRGPRSPPSSRRRRRARVPALAKAAAGLLAARVAGDARRAGRAAAPGDGEERLLRRSSSSPACFHASTPAAIGKLYGTHDLSGHLRRCWTVVTGSFALFILILLTFFAGELVWRERDARIDADRSTPCPRRAGRSWPRSWPRSSACRRSAPRAWWSSPGIVIQAAKGYFALRARALPRYDARHQLRATSPASCVLAVLIHVLIDQKYVGHFIMVVFLAVSLAAAASWGSSTTCYATGASRPTRTRT